ncbi:MAG: SMP-30/gluconolactonase/LRE family protein [Candidatus Zixiibacteriota bacterium]|nr:MAG: SMP-30/gluconolactonase/LRE family protein [candidate division Zixibacteria bacterium]
MKVTNHTICCSIPLRTAVVTVLSLLVVAAPRAEVIDFESDRWTLVNAEIGQHMGRKCLSGIAYLEDVEFEDGVIEVDIAVDGSRSYPGIVFRKTSPGDYERFYVRPHRAGLYPDALQYTPVFNGIAGWQLYNGDGSTAGVELPIDQWVHLRMEIKGTQARLYIDESEEPALEIYELQHGLSKGAIGLLGPRDATAYFSNFSYMPDPDLQFEPPPEPMPPLGLITDWEISQPFRGSEIDVEHSPESQGLTLTWQPVETRPGGLVDIARYTPRVGRVADWVWARSTIHADADTVRELRYGYSDYVGVFLNGRLLCQGFSAYQSRDRSFLGIIGLNDVVFLPLKKGENELLLAVGESFGGWGFMAQFGDTVYAGPSMQKGWEITGTLKYPESAVYDEERDVIYVSNYLRDVGNEFISRVGLDGEVRDLEWATGLTRPTGMLLDNNRLYVVERRNLAVIDVETGAISDRYPIPGAGFPNDIARDATGTLYISDSQGNKIHRFKDGQFDIWLEGGAISDPNGLLFHDGRLLVGNSGDGCLKSVRPEDKSVSVVTCLGSGAIVDGIKTDGQGNLIVSNYNGKVYLVSPTGDKTLLLDSSARPMNCADFDFIESEQLLVIPTFIDNRIMTYTYQPAP